MTATTVHPTYRCTVCASEYPTREAAAACYTDPRSLPIGIVMLSQGDAREWPLVRRAGEDAWQCHYGGEFWEPYEIQDSGVPDPLFCRLVPGTDRCLAEQLCHIGELITRARLLNDALNAQRVASGGAQAHRVLVAGVNLRPVCSAPLPEELK